MRRPEAGARRAEDPGVLLAGQAVEAALRHQPVLRQQAVLLPRAERLRAESCRQPAVCRGRRGAGRFAATERQPAVRRAEASWWLRQPEAAARRASSAEKGSASW